VTAGMGLTEWYMGSAAGLDLRCCISERT